MPNNIHSNESICFFGNTQSDSEYKPINGFLLVVDNQLAARISELSEAVKNHSAYSICEFNYSVSWFGEYFDGDELLDQLQPLDTLAVDIPCLNVSDWSFWFDAVPKHCADTESFATPRIDISTILAAGSGQLIFME